MVRWLTGVPSIDESNRRTGEVIPLNRIATIDTPLGTITTQSLLLDKAGIYSFDGRKIAANLYDPMESDLRRGNTFDPGSFRRDGSVEILMEKDLSSWFILPALILLIAELAVIRWRREL